MGWPKGYVVSKHERRATLSWGLRAKQRHEKALRAWQLIGAGAWSMLRVDEASWVGLLAKSLSTQCLIHVYLASIAFSKHLQVLERKYTDVNAQVFTYSNQDAQLQLQTKSSRYLYLNADYTPTNVLLRPKKSGI